jgi:hypothetical protein
VIVIGSPVECGATSVLPLSTFLLGAPVHPGGTETDGLLASNTARESTRDRIVIIACLNGPR